MPEREAMSEMEKLMIPKAKTTVDRDLLKPGTKLFVYHKISKPNAINQWIEPIIQETNEKIITLKREIEKAA